MLIPFVALLLIAVLPFGLDFVLVAPHLEVSAEATPPGAWNVLYLPLEHSDAGGSRAIGPLMHSSYHDPRAVRILSDWMKAIACTSPPAHPRPARGPASLR
jgi:hypothetical protein